MLRNRWALLASVVACAAALAALAAVSAGAGGGKARFSGKTAQGYGLRLTAGRRHVTLVRVKVKLRCRNGGLLFDDLSDFEPAALRPNRRFNDVQFGPSDEVHWRGAVSGAKVRGSIRVKDRLKNGVRCDSGNVRFAARRARR